MLRLLQQQEAEIGRLNSENKSLSLKLEERQLQVENTGSLAEAAVMVTGVMKAAQDAANLYLENIRNAEAHHKQAAEQIEIDARDRSNTLYNEAERVYTEAVSGANNTFDELMGLLDWHQDRVSALRDEFTNRVKTMAITQLLQQDEPDELDEFDVPEPVPMPQQVLSPEPPPMPQPVLSPASVPEPPKPQPEPLPKPQPEPQKEPLPNPHSDFDIFLTPSPAYLQNAQKSFTQTQEPASPEPSAPSYMPDAREPSTPQYMPISQEKPIPRYMPVARGEGDSSANYGSGGVSYLFGMPVTPYTPDDPEL